MNLILWRHAEAENTFPDIQRSLTQKGLVDAHLMGNWLKKNLTENPKIIVSPAQRTLQTAEGLSKDFLKSENLLPGCGVNDILVTSGWLKSKYSTVVIVGHQPVLGETVSYLITGRREYWNFDKNSIWWISKKKESNLTKIKVVMTNKILKKKNLSC